MDANNQISRSSQSCFRLLDESLVRDIAPHGNCRWALFTLLRVALAWAIGEETEVKRRFAAAYAAALRLGWQRVGADTYQGFLKALRRWTPVLRERLTRHFRGQMQTLRGGHDRLRGWSVLAVDGTRIAASRTQANERAFQSPRQRVPTRRQRPSRPKPARLPAGPQVWLTVLWHMGLGLAWDWRQGHTGSSERDHLQEMLDELPEQSLLVGDAGFQGFQLWAELQRRGISFVIRVGRNVRLIRRLGVFREQGDIVCLWPETARKKVQLPVLLRLLKFSNGRHPVYVVTNVLERTSLPDAAVGELYRRRWGVELFFRTLKQTFGRGRLRSHSPANVLLELDWSLLGLWCVELEGAGALIARGHPPSALSPVAMLRVVRARLGGAAVRSREPAHKGDGYLRRGKTLRRWPRPKRHRHAGRPQLRNGSDEECRIIQGLVSLLP